ncbi:PstS family phosphate ABC transporter substrate-binding protein [Sandaracinus amylolyticus]|uniref:PstS family phosphate ABC transporter substrate-binding protein n=1 Tax=Sandaracinus amylolyticus TaxID=927083 RepID=UPI001F190B93|nr:PstS family phosphate ABC transporter substrate-binding protein [Sandaracinus amylolyticus]UJR82507.1 Hypothetical protein I5071_45720 [Sandaracinus amylolyticus]
MIDGSSTVFPLSEVVAEAFHQSSRAPISVDESGTGGGFRIFCEGDSAIHGASRPITAEEMERCRAGGVEYVELPVAYDGIVVVVHESNSWASSMTLADLRRLFGADATEQVTRWRQVRAEWPDRELHVYAPGSDSGTFDTFTEAALGTPRSMRTDYDASEDDDYIVRRILRDPNGIGFVGYSYFAHNRALLRAVAIDDGNEMNGVGAIAPGPATIADGSYQPLSRPLFVYVSRAALDRREVAQLTELYLREARTLVPRAGMVTLRPRAYELGLARLRTMTTGSVFAYAQLREGLTVEQALEE